MLSVSFLLGALILKFYGISTPILRVAGGFIVAVAGWRLLNEGNQKDREIPADGVARESPLLAQAFYPLTLPLTTGPGSIAVVISIALSRATFADPKEEILFVIASLAAIAIIVVTIWLCFAYADRLQGCGQGGTDIAVRLSAFILFCLGLRILWSGGNELLRSVLHPGSVPSLP